MTERVGQLQRDRDDARNRMANANDELTIAKDNSLELLKLRGEVGMLQRQANEASQRARIAEGNLATELSSKTQFTKHEAAKINATKQLCLAMLSFLNGHGNQFPTNIVQLASELGDKFEIDGISMFSFEFLNAEAGRLPHRNMVQFRERLSRQAPDGTWRRIYGFSDGSVQTATSNDGNFETWEKANTYLPPPNQ